MRNCEVAIIGAGPYGLSIAAHLRCQGIGFRIFGVVVQNWRKAMPIGMFLKSDGAGTNLSDPADKFTLAHYCSSQGLPYSDHALPIARQTFVDYALSFQRHLVPEMEECEVVALAGNAGKFELRLDTGESLTARSVVIAVGTTYFGHIPQQFSSLPRELVTHSRDHTDLAKFAQREVVVVGGGQSALETAALLKEHGARVQVLVRAASVAWNSPPSLTRGLRRLCKPRTALGLGWKPWFYCHGPGIFQHFPLQFRSTAVARALGPAGAWWLKDRVIGRLPVLCGREVREVREKGGRISLSVVCAHGRTSEISADHVIAATGYKVDVESLSFLDVGLLQGLRREGTAPALSPDFESSVSGLYFAGLAASNRFGPSMRFVFGAEFAARTIAGALSKNCPVRSNSPKSCKGNSRYVGASRLQPEALPARKQQAATKFDTSIGVLVLNLGEYPFHQASLGIIRSLGSVGIPVFAVQRSPFIPSGASRYLSGKFLWQADGKNSDQFLEGLATIAKTLDRPTILLPTDDLSAILIAEHAEILSSSYFRFSGSPATLPRTVANKRNLYNLCQHLGVACPPTVFPNSRDEWLDFAKRTRLPVVVKVIEPWLARRGLKPTAIVSERQELLDYSESHRVPADALMIQEMIPSSTSEDWFVHGYCDGRSNPIAIFTGRKLRSYPAFAGPTTLARSVRNDPLQQQASAFLAAIGYQGIMDLDFRLDHRDGRYHLLDFNPRIGAQFRLFKDSAGIDVVRALHLDLTGQTVRVGPQIEGRTFVAEIQDVLASRAYWRSGTLVIADWWRSLRRIDEVAWYAADDPLPFLLMCIHMPLRALARALRSDRRSLPSAEQRRVTSSQQEPCQNACSPDASSSRSSFISQEL